MSITARHLIYSILEIASSGGLPTDFSISEELILHWIEETRSKLISQKLDKKDDINDSWVQYIPCVGLALADVSECCEAPIGCYVLKSTKRLPQTIDTWKDNSIISVSTLDGSLISKSNPFKHKYQKYNKYTSTINSWYIKNDYLYVINNDFLELVEVALLAETPSDLKRFTDCGGNSCFNLDSNYPVSLTLATQITDIIIKNKIAPFFTFSKDDSNNANSQTPQQKSQEKQANS